MSPVITHQSVNFIEKLDLSIPSDFKVTMVPDENFYYMFDLNSKMLKYVDSLRISVDKLMMEKMDMLKKMVLDKKLEMTFEQDFVSKTNSGLIKKIRKLNPYTIDWSNIPDYLMKEDFLSIAKGQLMSEHIFYSFSSLFTCRAVGYIFTMSTSQIREQISGPKIS